MRLLLILAIVGSATAGFISNLAYKLHGCHPPTSIRGKIELEAFHSDRNDDGIVDNTDFAKDIIDYDYDGDVSKVMEWEVIFHYGCEYGYDEDFTRSSIDSVDVNKDRVLTMEDDFSAPFSWTGVEYRQLLLQRFRIYCKKKDNKAKDCYKLQIEKNLDNFGNFSLPALQTKGN